MVLERPVFGQGPGMVEVVYPRFRWPEAPNRRQPHLHNNVMQIAAERGLPRGRLLPVVGGRRVPRRASRSAARLGVGARHGLGGRGSARRAHGGLRGRALRIQSRRLRGADAGPAADGRAVREIERRRPGLSCSAPLSSARARSLLRAMHGKRVLVLGDVMLDEFVWGRVARISPEAPVPVVEVAAPDRPPGRRRERGRQRRRPRRPRHAGGRGGPGRRRAARAGPAWPPRGSSWPWSRDPLRPTTLKTRDPRARTAGGARRPAKTRATCRRRSRRHSSRSSRAPPRPRRW